MDHRLTTAETEVTRFPGRTPNHKLNLHGKCAIVKFSFPETPEGLDEINHLIEVATKIKEKIAASLEEAE